MKRIAVLSALRSELEPFLDRVRPVQTLFKDTYFHVGEYAADFFAGSIIASVTGVGKTLSALSTQRVIDLLKPDHIFLIGSCGGATSGVEPGDVIVPESTAQSDYDITCSGRALGVIKGPNGDLPATLPTDAAFVRHAMQVTCSFQAVEGSIPERRTGLMATRDSLETDLAVLKRIEASIPYTGWEMEAASVHLVAWLNGCKFNAIKGVLDRHGVYDHAFSVRNEAAINFNSSHLLIEVLRDFER